MKRQARQQKKPAKFSLVGLVAIHMQAALYSFGRLWRTPIATSMTIAVIAIALSLPAGLTVILSNVKFVSEGWQDGSQITLFLQTDTKSEQIEQLITQIRSRPEVSYVNYISAKQGMRDLAQYEGFSELLTQLPYNPLPPVLEVYPDHDLYSAELLANIADNLQQYPAVESSQLDMQWLYRLNSIIALLQRGALAIALLFCSAIFLIITNTLRLTIQNSRQEIEVFKLVGASDLFIRRPFLYSGLFYGLSGGLIAWIFVSLFIFALQAPVRALADSYHTQFALANLYFPMVIVLLFISALLGVSAAYFVVKRQLATVLP